MNPLLMPGRKDAKLPNAEAEFVVSQPARDITAGLRLTRVSSFASLRLDERSTDFQSAVSRISITSHNWGVRELWDVIRISNPPAARPVRRLDDWAVPADWQLAIHQTGSLRYFGTLGTEAAELQLKPPLTQKRKDAKRQKTQAEVLFPQPEHDLNAGLRLVRVSSFASLRLCVNAERACQLC
jgi:hypothetical protein